MPGTQRKPEAPSRLTLLRLLAVLAVVLAPHVMHVPLWVTGLALAAMLWHGLAATRNWPSLPRVARITLALAAFAGVYASFGRVDGQTAGVTLLVVMAALKLTELGARRDVMVLGFLMYFLLVTQFLFSQEPWTAVYLLVCTVLITAVLIDASHAGEVLPLAQSLRISARLVGWSLPLMVVIFVLFPRIPGPLWSLRTDAGAARSGLSESMSPGDIANLVESDEVVFRVRFDGPAPPPRERYWRGPVFGHFDGRRWDAAVRAGEHAAPALEKLGGDYRYEVTLEPQATRTLFALELPSAGLPAGAALTPDFQLQAKDEVQTRRADRYQSFTRYRQRGELDPAQRAFYLQLPADSNPRTRALGASWRAQGLEPPQAVDAALAMFREESFFYTLRPPKLGRDAIDEFLFQSRRGFCEHYAASFTALMRAAGVPARVVTGYQGGEKNAVGGYYLVRQSDAHAWSEVWLEGQGWTRVDPTAAVAPERVEQGLGAALGESELPAFLDPRRRGRAFGIAFAARWDWANAQWNRWVLGYGPELQQDLLRRLGLRDIGEMILALTAAVIGVLAVPGVLLLRGAGPPTPEDTAQRHWQRMQRRLARAGLAPQPGEGPLDFSRRVGVVRPELAGPLARICALYLELRYLPVHDLDDARHLAQAIARLKL